MCVCVSDLDLHWRQAIIESIVDVWLKGTNRMVIGNSGIPIKEKTLTLMSLASSFSHNSRDVAIPGEISSANLKTFDQHCILQKP